MSKKKISKSRRILGDDDLAANLQAVLAYTGLTQTEFADELGIKPQAMNGYLMNRDNRKAINLYPKMVEMGINGDWYLTGNGPMLVSQLEDPSPSDRHAMEVGKRFIDLMKFSQETGTNSGDIDSTADCRLPTADCRLPTADCHAQTDDRPFVMPPARQQAGPPPSPEVFERAAQEGARVPIRRS